MIKGGTIAAISSAQGVGAVGMVRVSGPRALEIADTLFVGKHLPSSLSGGRFIYGKFTDSTGETIDSGILLIFRGPHSYTGEDVAEFQTHGSSVILSRVLNRTLELGARLAGAGEFTLRAYLEGKMDLSQAEAVNALISAQTDTARRQATLGLQGALGHKIDAIGRKIARVLAAIQAMLDYPEEGVPEEEREIPLKAVISELEQLLETARAGKLAQQGARLALIGKPNAGKSSLLNALLGYDRSIVTPIAGTTRDYLEAGLELAGIPITLIDTAGLRQTEDIVEQMGVEKALELAQGADLVLVLEDGTTPLEPNTLTNPSLTNPSLTNPSLTNPSLTNDEQRTTNNPSLTENGKRKTDDPSLTNNEQRTTNNSESLMNNDPRTLFIQTKTDLGTLWQHPSYLAVSAVTKQGLPELLEEIRLRLLGDVARGEVWLSSERQVSSARRALEHVRVALHAPDELASYELQEALEVLSEITGRKVSEEVIEGIFANFCVGK
jgi:tRNA modification GTPase